jgi:membrane protein YqaA with SNARE-associated domain
MPFALLISMWSWLERLGGIGLVLLGVADNSVVPMPGSMDALTVVLSAHQKDWWPYYAIMATIGGMVGGYMTYELGRKGGKEALEKKLPKRKAEKVYQTFEKYGFWGLFVPALLPPPVPFSPFLIAAGAMKYSRQKFFIAVGTARAIRYSLLAYLGSMYSKQIFGFFHHFYRPIFWTVLVLAILAGAGAGFYAWKRKREGKPIIPGGVTPAKVA